MESLEGNYAKGKPGDYLIKGVVGENYICERTADLDQLSPVLYNSQFKQESFQDIRIRVNEAVERKVRKVLQGT